MMSRKQFLVSIGLLGIAAKAAQLFSFLRPARHLSEDLGGATEFARTLICRVGDLKLQQPIAFQYLREDLGIHLLVKTGRAVPGGVGPDRDIVAYSTLSSGDALQSATGSIETALKKLPRLELEIDSGSIFAKGFSAEPISLALVQEIQGPQYRWAI